MSAKPYSEAEIAERRANPLCVYVLGQEPYPETMEQRWLATVDALKARLAAAEAEAERARGLLVEASGWMKAECYSLHHRRNQYHASDEACPVEALQSELLARIDAHLASRPEGEVTRG